MALALSSLETVLISPLACFTEHCWVTTGEFSVFSSNRSSLYPDLQQLASIHKVNMDLDYTACPPTYVLQAQAVASAPPLQELMVYAFHCEELELAKEQKEKKKLRQAQLQAYQGNQGGQQQQQRGCGKGKGCGGW